MGCGHSHFPPLPEIEADSATTRVADEIAMAIHLGELAGGEALREVAFSKRCGVSRTTVRAALQRLANRGLVEITPNRGARVSTVSDDTIPEIIELHAALMGLTARFAAERAAADQLEHMENFVSLMKHVVEDSGCPLEFQHQRVGFSRALIAAAGPILAERLRSALPVVPHHAYALEDIRSQKGQAEVARRTLAVLRAVKRRESERAERAAVASGPAPRPARLSPSGLASRVRRLREYRWIRGGHPAGPTLSSHSSSR